MNLAPAILGTTTVTKLKESAGAAVLEVGSDRFTRGQLAGVECFNFHAARLLTAVLKELKVPNLKTLYQEVPPAALAVPRMGCVSLAVLGAAFEAKGLGDLESYVAKHRNGHGGKVVTFNTLKQREQKELAQERKDRKRRKGQRRDQAHGIRVARFTQGWAQGAKEQA